MAPQQLEPITHHFGQWRGIEQRPPNDKIKLRGDFPYHAGSQAGLAHAADAVDDDQATAWLPQPARQLGAFLLVVAFLWPLWDDRCQTLYDKVAGTIVVRLRGSE